MEHSGREEDVDGIRKLRGVPVRVRTDFGSERDGILSREVMRTNLCYEMSFWLLVD